ncbi:helix-turn-helix domain-containing protein [Escherichia coli]|uniref:helix-turn-helix domain-containing protein n=1 Tax=Escherichia coli TaxID=562 RepID=UPI001FCDA732|nr:helix-turn-helix transcriptional regulator [Escherichia coli]
MTGWELRIWRKSMLWSREKAAREFGVTQRTWHAWENAEQVDVTVWRTTQALSVRDLLPHMQGMRKRLVRTVLIFTESSDQLSRATDRVPGLPASPGYVQ